MALHRIPTGQVRFIVDRLHVSTADAVIVADLTQRMEHTDLTTRERAWTIRYALAYHHRNQRLYADIMGGLI